MLARDYLATFMQKPLISYTTLEFDREVWAFGHLLPQTLNLTTKPRKSKLSLCKNRLEYRRLLSVECLEVRRSCPDYYSIFVTEPKVECTIFLCKQILLSEDLV